MPVNIFGRDPNQVPLNSHLGNLAYQNSDGTVLKNVSVQSGIMSGTHLGIGSLSNLTVTQNVSIANTLGIGSFITITPYNTLNSGTLSFEGSAGQLFSITNNLTSGSIFSVNDISGIPSIDVDANGTIQLAGYGGKVGIGTTSPIQKLDVIGNAYINGSVSIGTFSGFQDYTNSVTIKAAASDLATLYLWSNRSGNANHGAVYFLNQQGEQISAILGSGSTTAPAIRMNLVGSDIARFTPTGILVGSASSTGTSDQKLQVTGGAYVSGNLGIGLTNPGSALDVSVGGVGPASIRFSQFGDNPYIDWFRSTGIGTNFYGFRQRLITGDFVFDNAPSNPIGSHTYTERMRIDTAGRVLVGTSTARSNLFNSSFTSRIQVEGTTTNTSSILVTRSSADSDGPYLILAHSRGVGVSSNAALVANDVYGAFSYQGNDGTEFIEAASITAFADGNVGINSMPGRIVFGTTASGSSTATERMRIDSSGRLLVGTTSDPGNVGSTLAISNTGDSLLMINTTGSTNLSSIQFRNSNANGEARIVNNTGGPFTYYGNTTTERFRIDTSGRMLVGVSTSTSQSGVRGLIQVEATSGNEAAIKVKNNQNTNTPPYIAFTKSRGTTVGSSTTVQNGDSIGSLIWFAADGTDTESYCAEIYAQMDGAVGVNSVPGRLLFLTAASGQATTTERMRIDSSGRLLVGTQSISGYRTGVQHILKSTGTSYSSVSIGSPGAAFNTTELNITAWSGGGSVYYTSSIKQYGDGVLAFETQGSSATDGAGTTTERMRLDASTGNLLVGKNSTTANGGVLQVSNGITFPATQSACTDVNTLDDYEEGTWTVTFYDASAAGNASATTATGAYTKVGNTVRATFSRDNIDTTGLTAGNTFFFTLPFTAAATYEHCGSCGFSSVDLAAGYNMLTPFITTNAARGYFLASGDNIAFGNAPVSWFVDDTADLRVTIVYQV